MIAHLNKKNNPTIVDISKKNKTKRSAIAQGTIQFSKSTFKKIESLKTKKGEIINTSIIAGILGVKKTSEIIPLSHNIIIEKIDIDVSTNKKDSLLIITCYVKSFGKTGVEMEALTGVAITCLTIYDMCKNIDKKIVINNIQLLEKKGGKSDFLSF